MFEAIAAAASRWRNRDYPLRAAAVRVTLHASNRFTAEALDFAVNQQMSLLTSGNLSRWIGSRMASKARTVGVCNAGNVPLAGLQDLLAVCCVGHRYLGKVSRKSPALLPAFASDAGLDACFTGSDALWAQADAVIVTGSDATHAWASQQAARHRVPRHCCLLRTHRFSAAVLDGKESVEDRQKLAEDTLLHEGLGCRSVALIWAPEGLSPDPYILSFAAYRAAFPAHPVTRRSLKVEQALLHALGAPHVPGEAHSFLLSRGPARVQRPGHVRWVPYRRWQEVLHGLASHRAQLQQVFAREALLALLPGVPQAARLGSAQRPALDWQADGTDTVSFLMSL